MLRLFMITNNPEIAKFSLKWGVDNIFVDLEVMGKNERQAHLNSFISQHRIEDVKEISKVVSKKNLMVRINPLNENSSDEIERVLEAGAGRIMLPMFRTREEITQFLELVRGRAEALLLVETIGALNCFEDWVDLEGVTQVHIGLNDLHIETKSKFMFEPLANGMLDKLCKALVERKIPFGIGGIARLGEGVVSPQLVLSEHVRLASTWTILSRSFRGDAKSLEEMTKEFSFPNEVLNLRGEYDKLCGLSRSELEIVNKEFRCSVAEIVGKI